MDWKTKYFKYKLKYNKLLKEQHGGNKSQAKNIADYATGLIVKKNIFDEILLQPLSSDPILNIVINSNPDKEKIIEKLFTNISSLMYKFRFTHNVIRKDIYLISNFNTKNYTTDASKTYQPATNTCTNPDGIIQQIRYNNLPKSGINAVKDSLFVNTLPEFSTLKDVSTYNYVLSFVTDLNTNQTYYYLIFVEYTSFTEYSIKHSNLRVFLPDEWSYNDNIDHGFIATGELKIAKTEGKIIYDFNSSSNIIEMLEGKSSANCVIYDRFVKTFIKSDIKNQLIPDEQLFSLTYLFIINNLVKRTIDCIINENPAYSTFKAEIHSDYLNRSKLLTVAGGNEKIIYTRGLLIDPYPHKLGGLHDYANNRCYTNEELEKFNTNTIKQYDDLDDNNIDFSKLNCIREAGNDVQVNSLNPENDKIFKESINCKV